MVETDPVCHMEVESSSEFHWNFRGTEYHFCREGCKRKFMRAPLTFLAPTYDPATFDFDVMADAPASTYTCPMDPEIVQDGPGICPKCGMALEPMTPNMESPQDNTELADMTKRFWISAVFTVPLLVVAMSSMGHVHVPLPPPSISNYVQLGLTLPVVLWCGAPIFQRCLLSLKTRNLNMFTLIGIGTAVAFLYSTYATITGTSHIYFETSAAIITLVLLGQVLELRSRATANTALHDLLALTPPTTIKLTAGSPSAEARTGGPPLPETTFTESTVPVSEVGYGDLLRIRPGDKIPVDGTIYDGTGSIDESMLTGEPNPVAKTIGAAVTAGTINTEGSFIMEATRIGDDTLLAQIVRMVAQAQRSQAPIQRLADRVSAYFVPFVLITSALTFIAWLLLGPAPRLPFAILNAIAVLIIACPCALGLATPMSIIVATGRGAKSGILIKNAATLETAEQIQVVALDKTGTLTEGKPTIAQIIPATSELTESDILRITASLEVHSSHPIANAILTEAKSRGLSYSPASDFQLSIGKGIQGTIDNMPYAAGTRAFMHELGVEIPSASSDVENAATKYATTVFLSSSHKLLATILLSDPLRASAVPAVSTLRSMGLEVVVLTGDNEHAAAHIAASLNLPADAVYANLLPTDKSNIIASLKSTGKKILMTGDGINDAIALAQADLSIALSSGTDIAMQTADITLVSPDLNLIPRALKLSRRTMLNIKQNLFFAFIYNTAGILVATGILYPITQTLLTPIWAAAAMSVSSVCVILNALRLRTTPL